MNNNILESKKCKVVFFGENNVGKTNIITRYCKNFFNEHYESTNNSVNYHKFIKFDDYKTNIELLIWDTGLSSRFRSMMLKFYTDADVIVLVYKDIESLQAIQNFWYKAVKEQMMNNPSKILFYIYIIVICVVKNFCDNGKDINVTQEEFDFVNKENVNFRLISAKDDIGINELFKSIGKEFLNKIKE